MFRFFIPLILFSFSIMLYTGYTKPNVDVIESVKREIDFASSTISVKKDEIEEKRKELEEVRKSIPNKDRERVMRLVPSVDEFDEAAFMNDINNIALQHSMSLRGISVSGISNKDVGGVGEEDDLNSGEYVTVSMSFSVTNTYSGIKSFLRDLEKSEQLLDVVDISFVSASDDEESNYQITINTYYWIP